jgi:hypothetical protein
MKVQEVILRAMAKRITWWHEYRLNFDTVAIMPE